MQNLKAGLDIQRRTARTTDSSKIWLIKVPAAHPAPSGKGAAVTRYKKMITHESSPSTKWAKPPHGVSGWISQGERSTPY